MFTEVFEHDLEAQIRAPEASLFYSLWQVMRGDACIPREEMLPEKRIAYLKSDMMILRPVGHANWRYEHYGSNIAAQAGFDMTGRTVADFQGPTRAFYLDIYARVTATSRPIATVHRLGRFAETPLWERLILPFGVNSTVSCLYVINKVREFARDMSHLNARARERGLLALQFVRDDSGRVMDAEIVGVNAIARDMIDRRHDELAGHRCRDVLPGVHNENLWEACLRVVDSRQSEMLEVENFDPSIPGCLRMEIGPLFDGVTIVFPRAEPRSMIDRVAPIPTLERHEGAS